MQDEEAEGRGDGEMAKLFRAESWESSAHINAGAHSQWALFSAFPLLAYRIPSQTNAANVSASEPSPVESQEFAREPLRCSGSRANSCWVFQDDMHGKPIRASFQA